MIIRNIHDLASHFGTTAPMLKKVLSDRARCKLYIAETHTSIRIGTEVPGCNAEFCMVLRFPFESSPVDVFVDTVCHNATEAYQDAFDDPVELVMNRTNPGENLALDDAERIISEAIANGWHFSPDVNPQLILDIHNDLEQEEEE